MKRFSRNQFFALALTAAFAALPLHTGAAVSAGEVDQISLKNAEIVICAINDIRVANGLSELSTTPLLLEVSDTRAEEIVLDFSHYRPDGSVCFTALKSEGITYSFSAENIASGRSNPVATVDQWMQSEGHRANILNENFTHIGIGYTYDPDSTFGYYWSMFLIGVYDGTSPYVYEDQYIPGRALGDVNGTKSVNADDASVVLQYAAQNSAGLHCNVVKDFKRAADVNSDGTINSIDASIILTYAAAMGSGQNITLEDCIW